MQIQFIDTYNNTYKKDNIQNTYRNISFCGETNNLDIINEKEIEFAREHIGEDDWEEKYYEKRLKEIHPSNAMDHCDEHPIYTFISAACCFIPTIIDFLVIDTAKTKHVKNVIQPEIRRIRQIMFNINNDELQRLENKKKEYSKDIKIRTKDNEVKQNLYENFIKPMSDTTVINCIIPTAVMLEGGSGENRKFFIDWIKDQITQRTVEFALSDDEDDSLYRINTEIEYAQEYYDKTGKRTVLFIDNFANILTSSQVSSETIAEMKSLLSDISEEKAPVSIVFDIDDSSVLDSAFTGNKSRIPLSINLNNK